MLTNKQRAAHNQKYRDKNLAKHREWARKSYQKHRAKRRATMALRYATRRQIIDNLKAKPCLDCGREYPSYVMEFHHRDPATKVFKVAVALVGCNLDKVFAEIAKCDLLCANCHRIREWGENGLRKKAVSR